MDPLSISTAVLALIQATKTCFVALQEFRTSCKEADADISKLERQLKTLGVLLHHVSTLSSSNMSSISDDDQQHVLATVKDCKSLTLHVSDLLGKYSDNPRRSQLWWAAKGKKEVAALMEKVESSKSTLTLIVGVQNRSTVVEVSSNTKAIKCDTDTLMQTTAAIQGKADMIPEIIQNIERLHAMIATTSMNGTSPPKGIPEMLEEIRRLRALMPQADSNKHDLMAWVDSLTSYAGSVATTDDSFDLSCISTVLTLPTSKASDSRKASSELSHKSAQAGDKFERIRLDCPVVDWDAEVAKAQWIVTWNSLLESSETETEVAPGLLMAYTAQPDWELNQCCLSPSGSLAAGVWYQNSGSKYRYKIRFWCVSEVDELVWYEIVSDMVHADYIRPSNNKQVIRLLDDDIVAVQESEGSLAFWEIKISRKIGVIPMDGRKAGAWDAAAWASTHHWVATVVKNVIMVHYIALSTRSNVPAITTSKTHDFADNSSTPQAVCFSTDGQRMVVMSRGWLDNKNRVTINTYDTSHAQFSTFSPAEFASSKIPLERSVEIRLGIDIVRDPSMQQGTGQDNLRIAVRDEGNAIIIYDGHLICLTVDIMTDTVRNHSSRQSLDRSIKGVSRNGKRAMVASRDSDDVVRMHSLSIEHMVDADASPEFTVTCPQEMSLERLEAAISSEGETILTWPGYLGQPSGSSKAIWSWKVLQD